MDENHREEILRILREAINAVHSAEMCATLRATDMEYDALREASCLIIGKLDEIVGLMGGYSPPPPMCGTNQYRAPPPQIEIPVAISPGIWTPTHNDNEFVRQQIAIFDEEINRFPVETTGYSSQPPPQPPQPPPLTPYEAWRMEEGLRPWQEEAAELEEAAAVFQRKPASNSVKQSDQATQTDRRPRRNKRTARRKAPVLDKRLDKRKGRTTPSDKRKGRTTPSDTSLFFAHTRNKAREEGW